MLSRSEGDGESGGGPPRSAIPEAEEPQVIRILLRRAAWTAFTLWVVFSVTFLLIRAVPGGPYSGERQLTPEVEREMKARYRLDQPIWVQYGDALGSLLRGDLGASFRLQDFSVNEIVAGGFRVSASLGVLALWFALALGIPAGILSAVRRGTWQDAACTALATVGIAVPNFVFAATSVLIFSFWWPILPPAGWGSAAQLVLPAVCLGLPYAAYIARLTRAGMVETLGQDFIRTARAKGLSDTVILGKHALRGALLPVVSFLGPAAAGILSGSVVVERIFALPGLGSHFIEAALQRDYTTVMGLVMVYAVLVCVLNLIVDFSYTLLDPRISAE